MNRQNPRAPRAAETEGRALSLPVGQRFVDQCGFFQCELSALYTTWQAHFWYLYKGNKTLPPNLYENADSRVIHSGPNILNPISKCLNKLWPSMEYHTKPLKRAHC